ncbi:hypothetical protein N7494_001286 [Penicillium frequentans]|uniref:Uncharacterized protein n=1 Tax=Penicillium frequentans TaxID=3151616 RepID=A0AAD6GKK8_9EURO|nr:hypothetical protein N7494_001286 [Penicillium glabrum]
MAISTGRPQKVTGAPDYDNPDFWDDRFATGQDVGEWLNSGEALIDAVVSDLESRPVRRPRVLHLGPGVSQLGLKLRDACVERHWNGNGIVVSFSCTVLVKHISTHGDLMQNVDFSGEAVRLGQAYESQKPPRRRCIGNGPIYYLGTTFPTFCRSHRSTTSDAIATATDRHFASTDDLSQICPAVRELLDTRPSIALSPVELLGLHLVPLTQKDTTWIVMSYSTFRFGGNSILDQYWTLRSRTPLKAPAGPVSSSAYTPDVFHWIYILDRK